LEEASLKKRTKPTAETSVLYFSTYYGKRSEGL